MNINKKELYKKILQICKSYEYNDIIYAGLVGSNVIDRKNSDIDLIIITSKHPDCPCLIKESNISYLFLNESWLKYDIHLKKPKGLVPSILFKSLDQSIPLIGKKSAIDHDVIKVCRADFINVKIKKERYKDTDHKNYLVSLIFEKLLEKSTDLSIYSFDNVEMAKRLGLNKISRELKEYYNTHLFKI